MAGEAQPHSRAGTWTAQGRTSESSHEGLDVTGMKLLLPLGISMHFITGGGEATMEASRCLGLPPHPVLSLAAQPLGSLGHL